MNTLEGIRTKQKQRKEKKKNKQTNLSSNNFEASLFSFPEEPRECMGPDGREVWAPKVRI